MTRNLFRPWVGSGSAAGEAVAQPARQPLRCPSPFNVGGLSKPLMRFKPSSGRGIATAPSGARVARR